MGITRIANAIAMPYSVRPMGVNPNAFARKGTSNSNVVRIKDPIIAAHRTLFWPFREKMDFLWERTLKEWKISHIDMVRNAMVMPWSEAPNSRR